MTDQKIVVPDMGDFKDVEIIEVLVKEGQLVKKNDSLITLESDKSSVEVPSTHEGVIKKISIKIGDKVNQGDLILSLRSVSDKEEKKTSEVSQETTKEIQRYLYIAPSTLQLLFSQNLDVDSIFAEYKTAPDLWKDIFQDKLQKKRFKIRLTSKSSGRKIDFNFAFNKLFPGGQKAIYGTNLQGIHKWTIVAADED